MNDYKYIGMKEENDLPCMTSYLFIFTYLCRLYTGPKDQYTFNVLSSPAYTKVMDNNVDLDLSFNSWSKSMKKTLKEPKRALFTNTKRVSRYPNFHCQVKLN